MNYMARRIVEDRMRNGDRRMRDRGDYRGGDYRGRDYGDDYEMRDRGDYRGGDFRGTMEYRGEIEHDGRRGVYGTGRYGVGGRDHGEDYRYRDYGEDYRGNDYGEGEEMKLKKSDMKKWKKKLKNSDGSDGEHFNAEQIHEVAHHVGAKFDEYDEADLCMTANMLYSDLGEAIRSLIPREKEAMIYAKMARYWLEDEDGPKGSEKLALYYYCIVDGEEE